MGEWSEKHLSMAKAESPGHTSRSSFYNRNLSSLLSFEPPLPIQVKRLAPNVGSNNWAASMKQLKSVALLRLKELPSLSSAHLTTLKSPIKHHQDRVDSLKFNSESQRIFFARASWGPYTLQRKTLLGQPCQSPSTPIYPGPEITLSNENKSEFHTHRSPLSDQLKESDKNPCYYDSRRGWWWKWHRLG